MQLARFPLVRTIAAITASLAFLGCGGTAPDALFESTSTAVPATSEESSAPTSGRASPPVTPPSVESTPTGTSPDLDAGTAADTGGDSSSPTPDASLPSLDGGSTPAGPCPSFVDRSNRNASRTITLGKDKGVPTYQPACIEVRVGQAVTWNLDLFVYPLEPTDIGSPIPPMSFGRSATALFFGEGTYGFRSPNEPSLRGAVRVIP